MVVQEENRILQVHAEPHGGVPLDEEDADVGGVYQVSVPADLPTSKAAAAALDVFHTKIGIEVLDDFSIFVTDEDGEVVDEDISHDDYSCSHMGDLV
jgi:hypothetical protein